MKPILLQLKSFGSYREETIDFSNINHGIFLITGDTGAGKTTIFDAITYALFDQSSGGNRKNHMMISQFAEPNERTEVVFKFAIGDDEYTIKRSPEQIKYKEIKDENGGVVYQPLKTSEKPSVELILPDGQGFSGKKSEIDEKIKEIIGIDGDQFTQIVMLAQNDFLKLLHASSKERKYIFSKIFNTYGYAAIEDELAYRNKNLEIQLKDNQKLIEDRLEDIVCLPGGAFEEAWEENGSFSDDRQEDILKLIQDIMEEVKNSISKVDSEIDKLEKDNEKLLKTLNEAERINQDFAALQKAKDLQKQLEDEAETHNQRKVMVQKAEKALLVTSAYDIHCSRKQDTITAKEQLLENRQKDITLKEKLDHSRKALEVVKEAFDKQYDQIIARQKELEQKDGLYDELEAYLKELGEIKAELNGVDNQLAKLGTLELTISDEEKCIEAYKLELEINKAEYEKTMSAFLENQASLLRSTLEEGKPCPVCGSIHHELVHTETENVVSKEDVDKSRSAVEEKEKLIRENEKSLDEKKNQHKEQKLLAETKKATAWARFSEKEQLINKTKDKLPFATRKELTEAVEALVEQAVKLKTEKENAEESYRLIKEEADSLKGTIDNLEKSIASKQMEEQHAREVLDKELAKNGFADVDLFLQAKLKENVLEQYKEAISNYEKQLEGNRHDLINYEERTAGKSPVDTTVYLEQKTQCETQIRKLRLEKQDLNSILSQNQNGLSKISESYESRAKLREQYVLVNGLYETANGKLPGKKINFQTYVQRRYFKKVIAAANERLIHMSNNQFLLQCRELQNLGSGNAEVGLDLDVYSVINDQVRDVKSLSGGESFMAALSMALGLSDIVQNSAGRIRIDTMFIDEGFGSLSDETRNQALNLLTQLSQGNQLIGIISHVSELKAQVDTKLVITKSEKGSKATWQI